MSRLPFPVVDADAHIIEGPELFARFLDPAFRDRAPRIVADSAGVRRMLYEGRVVPPFPEGRRSSWRNWESPAERVALMDYTTWTGPSPRPDAQFASCGCGR